MWEETGTPEESHADMRIQHRKAPGRLAGSNPEPSTEYCSHCQSKSLNVKSDGVAMTLAKKNEYIQM